MHRSILRGLLLLAVPAAAAAGCSNGTSTPITTTPTAPAVNEPPFTGTLQQNGSAIVNFNTTGAGIVTATVATLDPTPPTPSGIELDMGTWNGITCAVTLATPNVVAGSVATGQAAGAGALCVRVADANGTLTTPTNFAINVVHF